MSAGDDSFGEKIATLLLRKEQSKSTNEVANKRTLLEAMLIKQLKAVLTEMPDRGLFVIKKHFGKLCDSLPSNYEKTVKKLQQLTDFTEEDRESILPDNQLADPIAVNQRILMYLFMNCQSCDHLMKTCSILEELADPAKQLNVANFHRDAAIITKGKGVPVDTFSNIKFFGQFEEEGLVVLKKHYDNLMTSVPKDYKIIIHMLSSLSGKSDDEVIASQGHLIAASLRLKESSAQEMILHSMIVYARNDYRLLGFSYLLENATQDPNSAAIESFRNDCLELLQKKASHLMQNFMISSNKPDDVPHPAKDSQVPTISLEKRAGVEELKVFKKSYHKLVKVLPFEALSDQLISSEIITVDEKEKIESFSTSTEKASFVLIKIGKSLEAEITQSYYALITIMKNYGGDAAVLADELTGGNYTSKGAPEIFHQFPPSCPANYIPRVKILQEIISAVINSDITPTIGTTVTIRGIGGIGKSTIAKALCHDPLMQKHFKDGFLWISLTPPLPSLTAMLSEIYQRLSDEPAPMNVSILENKIKSLVSSHSCKLLVILDDVWDAEDAMTFVNAFSSCKTVMTTRKIDINSVIRPKKCFDVSPMLLDEAVKLLTLDIVELETLHSDDISKIQELAKDLHCWPLLLNLVHGQLYVYCIEWNESPQDAILNAQKKLHQHGLTAFDPDHQTSRSREIAVNASITASLELLSKEEKMMLYYITSSSAGFGVYTCKAILPDVMKVTSEQFNKCTKILWCQGLISFESVTIPFITVKIPCIKIHDVIAQYISEEIPNDLYKKCVADSCSNKNTINLFNKHIIFTKKSYIGFSYLAKIDVAIIPWIIRTIMLLTKMVLINLIDELTELMTTDDQLQQDGSLQNFLDNELLFVATKVKQIHKLIKEDCKSIHRLLAESKHDEAILWIRQYFKTHPVNEKLTKTITYLSSLCDSSLNQESMIKELIACNTIRLKMFNAFQTVLIQHITYHKHILLLMDAGASDKDILCYHCCVTTYNIYA